MSITVLARVLWTEIPDLKAVAKNGKEYTVSPNTAKSVMVAMADNADDFGENSFNSIDTLSKKSSLKQRTIPRVLRALQQNGYCIYKGLSIYGTSNYSINLQKLGSLPEKRAKNGRPKTTESGNASTESDNETTESGNASTESDNETTESGNASTESETPESSLIISKSSSSLTPAELSNLEIFTNAFGMFVSNKEGVRWYEFVEKHKPTRAREIVQWALKKEIHLTNRAALMDSIETAAERWTGRKQKPRKQEKSNGLTVLERYYLQLGGSLNGNA